ncbi:MAG: hypothetical protein KJO11_13195 [Gemmatimonadetes bacterium]|nr:hypothetical protein [Gemmatimonadota bacterium]
MRGGLRTARCRRLAAQGPGTGAPPPDTVTVDSTALRIRQRLQLLNRGPGADSARAQAYADSLEAGDAARAGAGRPRPESAPRGPDDDLYAVLRGLAGYTTTEYQGRAAEYSAGDGLLILHGDTVGKARVSMADGQLEADSVIRYNEQTGALEARGSPIFLPQQGDQIQAEALDWQAGEDVGSARQARMEYNEGARWNITSDFPEISPGLAFGHKARFTSCNLEEPHYHFETDQLKIVRGSILVARPVRLYFGDVPVAWLPFIAQGLGRGRSSGILTPRFSINDIVRTSGGYRRRVSNLGFYWAMSQYSDASVALDWFDDNYTAITGTARYRWARRFMQGSLSFRQYWRAEGGTELTLNTSHQWQMSERTNLNVQAAYASSSRFVTQNSFNPTEVTQSIDSQGGLQRRFDWGNLSVSGNRRQFLSDDRVEQTFPSVNLSLSTITLFPAPQNRAGIFNNLTLSGSGSLRRSTTTRAEDDPQPDRGSLSGTLRSTLNLGRLSVGGGLQYREESRMGVTLDEGRGLVRTDSLEILAELPEAIHARGAAVFQDPDMRDALLQPYTEIGDIADTNLNWSANVDFQQNLIGSTTLTPSVSWSGELRRADTLALAQDFVAAPTRVSFGAALRSDIYGFLPGFGPWERLRHKVSPSLSYSYSPEVQPTDLQKEVFGSAVINPRNVLTLGLNQTFEARVRSDEPEEGDSTSVGLGMEPQRTEDGFLIPEQAETQLLLGIQTSALAYDFVADSTGRVVDGLTTASLNNTIRSDFLRGLTISMRHDLFEDPVSTPDGLTDKKFAPHLEGMNFNYSFSNRSSIFRWLGFGGGEVGDDDPSQEPGQDPFAGPGGSALGQSGGAADQESIVPTQTGRSLVGGRESGPVGAWQLNLGYSLIRPRESSPGQASQSLAVNFTLKPTQAWDMSWRTSYDLENGGFNDHIIRLTRDIHRWQANFDFLQTANGNWTFRFEVSLTDNRDLKFDYQQRSIDRGTTQRLPF